MYKKAITYKTVDGDPITEDFYFNLNKAEITEIQFTYPGGFAEYLERISTPPVDGGEIMVALKDIVRRSVGRRSDDGKRFDKSDEITAQFMNSEAYSEFFIEILTNPDTSGQEFVNAVMPKDLVAEITAKLPESKSEQPAWMTEGRVPNATELVGATPDQIQEAFRRQAEAKQQ